MEATNVSDPSHRDVAEDSTAADIEGAEAVGEKVEAVPAADIQEAEAVGEKVEAVPTADIQEAEVVEEKYKVDHAADIQEAEAVEEKVEAVPAENGQVDTFDIVQSQGKTERITKKRKLQES